MSSRFFTLFLILLFVSYASAKLPKMSGVPTADPESVGMSAERLKKLDAVMQGYIDRNETAGVVTLVARKGKVVHFSALGKQDVENDVPMRPDTIFRMASMTKPITSVALMMLYEEGYFQLRDPVSKWLPEYGDMHVAIPAPADERLDGRYKLVPAKSQITIQQLLTHTAGLSNGSRGITQPEYAKAMASFPLEETDYSRMMRLAKLPLNFHPGEAWEYTLGTSVVGVLVEQMSGMTLDEFFQERILKPLDMTDTHFFLPESKLPRFAANYGPDENKKIYLTEAADKESRFVRGPHVQFRGAGGLVTTTRDYFRFCQMMLNGGELDGVRILSRKTVEMMTISHTGDLPIWLTGPGYGFGLGFAIVTDMGPAATPRSEGSYFWSGAHGTIFWVDPKEELIGIIMEQIYPYTQINIMQDMASMTYQAVVD
ncbi:MAG: serine hydrolase [Verrucomicrobia bacterium]|nr:serine hydrolase [Verrucomicrobiota bacterium]MDA1068858.1 serine hydrolase [Verrucomicrobiota bacterium]